MGERAGWLACVRAGEGGGRVGDWVPVREGGRVQVILASADSSLKAGIEHSLKTRIDSVVYYASVYDTVRRCGGWIL